MSYICCADLLFATLFYYPINLIPLHHCSPARVPVPPVGRVGPITQIDDLTHAYRLPLRKATHSSSPTLLCPRDLPHPTPPAVTTASTINKACRFLIPFDGVSFSSDPEISSFVLIQTGRTSVSAKRRGYWDGRKGMLKGHGEGLRWLRRRG